MCAVPNMAVFCSSRTSCLPGMLPTYFLNDFETVPVAPIITGLLLLLLLLLLLPADVILFGGFVATMAARSNISREGIRG